MCLLYRLRGTIIRSLLLLVLSGCAGIEPYTPINRREEGLGTGLFSGSEGGFVIYRKGAEPATESPDKFGVKEIKRVGQQGNN